MIPGLINDGTSKIETFQNSTLRPIIKMQHDLLIALFQNYLQKRNIKFFDFNLNKKQNQINSIFTKDVSFKNMIIGTILGHFSMEEYHFYSQYPHEINKRIGKIVQKRIEQTLL
ncbi:MAG: Uncharacterised protein [Flavobacterium sp. SCGC AAA160-P02]|nr:MAG: Uncharacterised protein [Flavobacterium sp. SCGC AAA160-P02]